MSVSRAVRLIALDLLANASAAARALRSSPADPGVRHEFRVAVRRLQSWLKLWRPELRNGLRRKDEKRIRRVARMTGPARDLDIQLEWVVRARRSAPADERQSLASVGATLRSRNRAMRAEVARAAGDLLARTDGLRRRLATYCVDVRDAGMSEASFDVELARTVRDAAHELHERLSKVSSPDDSVGIHAARTAAKRMRYLLLSVRRLDPATGVLIRALATLQDDAGALHDTSVLKATLRSMSDGASLSSYVEHRLDADSAKSYSALQRRWLGPSAARFFDGAQRLAARLDQSSRD